MSVGRVPLMPFRMGGAQDGQLPVQLAALYTPRAGSTQLRPNATPSLCTTCSCVTCYVANGVTKIRVQGNGAHAAVRSAHAAASAIHGSQGLKTLCNKSWASFLRSGDNLRFLCAPPGWLQACRHAASTRPRQCQPRSLTGRLTSIPRGWQGLVATHMVVVCAGQG